MNRFVLVVAVLLGVFGCSEPLVTIPGGELAGVEQDAPAQWSQVPDTIQLETRRSDPYSINIWGVGVAEHLYVATGSDGTKWTPFIDSDPGVRVRVDGDLYPLRASLVEDPDERARVATAYEEKYELDRHEGWVAGGMIFRLDRP